MNSVTSKIKIDFLRPVKNVVKLARDDAYVRKFEISLYAGGQAYEPDDNNVLYAVYFTKPDGTTGGYDTMPDNTTAAVTRSGNVLTVKLAPQVTTAPGNVKFGVALYKAGGDKLQTFDIDLMVEDSAGAGEISDNYWNLQSLAGIQAAVTALEALCVDFTGATSSAGGTHGLVPAPSSVESNKYLKGSGNWAYITAEEIGAQTVGGIQSQDVQGILEGLNAAIPAPMTAASSQAAGTGGTVPAPAAGSNTKYLRGDASWSKISASEVGILLNDLQATDVSSAIAELMQDIGQGAPLMQAASASAAGSAGVVPAPAAGDNTKFLRGDATWASPTAAAMTAASSQAAGTGGSVPAPAAGDNAKFLRGDATWATPAVPVMTGATEQAAGTSGAVPAPSKGSSDRKYLRADAMWHEIEACDIPLNDPKAINGDTPDDAEEAIWMLNTYIGSLITQLNTALASVVGGGSNA